MIDEDNTKPASNFKIACQTLTYITFIICSMNYCLHHP